MEIRTPDVLRGWAEVPGSTSLRFSATASPEEADVFTQGEPDCLRLEEKLASKLNLTSLSSGGDLAEGCAAVCGVQTKKVRMVKCVEHFCAELETEPLRDQEILEDSKIPILQRRSDYRRPARIAEC